MSLEKAKKLKALADRGYKGEKKTAEKILKLYCKKHGIRYESLLDLDQENLKARIFKFKNGEESLLVQIIGMITNKGKVYGTRGRSNELLGECTDSEAVQVLAMYEHYSKCYREELEVFMIAFIQKHNLFRANSQPDKNRKPDPKELEKQLRAMKMANGIKQNDFIKRLTN